MTKLNILFVTHNLSLNVGGGAETQILKTREKLSGICNVKLFNMWTDKLEEYDIVHIFNPGNFPVESANIARVCNEMGISLCVSPIYWFSLENFSTITNLMKKAYINSLKIPFLNNITSSIGTYNYLKELFELSNVIMPNTHEELSLINSIFNISKNKFSLVPNGVEKRFKTGNNKLFKEKYGINNFILYVGGIYPRKNVLGLIRAFSKSELDTNLVIIGKKVDQNYYSTCKKESDNKTIFLEPLSHDSTFLKSAYKAAKVVALPSYFETPGLSALEGGLAGSNVVVTEIGGTNEYFGKYAWYVNPKDEKNIKNALISAYNAPKANKLSEIIENNFIWEKVAKITLNIYKDVLND